ncbi:hypothetical protein E2320_005450, partial [Naja naja]
MMSMNMNNRGTMPGPAMGPGPSLGPEGTTNIGTPMMPDNGTVNQNLFSEKSAAAGFGLLETVCNAGEIKIPENITP